MPLNRDVLVWCIAALVAVLLPLGCKKSERALPKYWDGPAPLVHRSTTPPLERPIHLPAFPVKGKLANLVVPVDWKQDPHDDRSWRSQLHGWTWAWPLLRAFDVERDQAAFLSALEIARDWLRQNPRDAKDVSEFAWSKSWSGTRVAARAEAMAFMLRAGAEAKLLPGDAEQELLDAIREHGARLADDDHYEHKHNHGLLQDYGLATVCFYLPKLETCPAWKDLAAKRFLENAKHAIDSESGAHLEHSPQYHFFVIPIIERMVDLTKDRAIQRLIDKMRSVGGWLVAPDGRPAIVGDTSWDEVPAWAKEQAKGLAGVAPLQPAGYGIVKTNDSYLLTFAGHHSDVHKHRDDLTFVWFEAGRQVLTDTGKFAYRYDRPERGFAVSRRAHNTLVVDDDDPRLGKPYGSAILATGEGDGWYAIVARNPHLRRQKVKHRRTWLYRPRDWLVVIDDVEARKQHHYDRYFHFWHERDVNLEGDGRYSAKLDDTTVVHGGDFSSGVDVDARLVRNRRKPLQGVMFPLGPQARPNDVVVLGSDATSARFVHVFRVGAPLPRRDAVTVRDIERGYQVELDGVTVDVVRRKRNVELRAKTAEPAATPK